MSNYTKSELIENGFKDSPFTWYADRFFFCGFCKEYQYHDVFVKQSVTDKRIEVLICKKCEVSRLTKEN